MRVIPQLLFVEHHLLQAFSILPHPHLIIDHTPRPVRADAGQSVVTNSSVLFIIWNALLHMANSVTISHMADRGLGDTAAIRERAAYRVPRWTAS